MSRRRFRLAATAWTTVAMALTGAACAKTAPNAQPSPVGTAIGLTAGPVVTDRAEPTGSQPACAGTTERDQANTGRGLPADRGGASPPTTADPVSTAFAEIVGGAVVWRDARAC